MFAKGQIGHKKVSRENLWPANNVFQVNNFFE